MIPSGAKTSYGIELKDGTGRLIYAETDRSDTAVTRWLAFLVSLICEVLLYAIRLANQATQRVFRTYDAWRSQWCQSYRSAKTPRGFREGKINPKTLIFALHNRRK